MTFRFKMEKIVFPRIESIFFVAPTEEEFERFFRIEGNITEDNKLRLLFGMRLVSQEELEVGNAKVDITVEAIATFICSETLPEVSKVGDIPLAGNMLAMVYPFIREKMNYCLSSNGFNYFLPPINTIAMLKDDGEGTFSIEDSRAKKSDEVNQEVSD